MQRLGDLRQSGDGENGVWLRLKGTKISRDGRFSFENKYTTYELGYDKVLRQTDDYTRYGGVAFSYGDGSSSYAGGSGSNHNKAIGLYGTQINKRDIIWTWCSNTPIWIMILAFWIQKGKNQRRLR